MRGNLLSHQWISRAFGSVSARLPGRAALWMSLFALAIPEMAHAAELYVTDVRSWSSPDNTRVVLDLTAAPTYSVRTTASPPEVVIDIEGARPRAERLDWDAVDTRITGISLTESGTGARVTIRLARDTPYKHFSLTPYRDKPHRIVVDLLPPAPPEEPRPMAASTDLPAGGYGRPFVVVVDAGHGGEDPGAIGRYYGTREKDVVLQIARQLKRELDAIPGIQARMTRDGDYFISLGGRIRKADRLGGDLFVSIHADTSRNRRTRGTHVYTLAPRSSQDRRAIRVAQMENASDYVGGVQAAARLPVIFDSDGSPNNTVESRVVAELAMAHLAAVNQDGREGRRSEARFWVLKGSRPSILVESGFLSNRSDERSLRDVAFQQQLARQLATAIADYYHTRFLGPTVIHTVRRGESLSGIASRYGIAMPELARVNRIADASHLMAGEKLVVPGRGYGNRMRAASAAPQATAVLAVAKSPRERTKPASRAHTVHRGESLTRIAQQYGIRLSDLMTANHLTRRSRLEIGQKLVIPDPRSGDLVHTVVRGDSLVRVAQGYGVPLSELARVNDLRTNARLKRGWKLVIPGDRGVPRSHVHMVRRGETLSGLAQRFGVTLGMLARANGLSTRTRLLKGQRLVIPGVDAPAPRVHVTRTGESLSRIAQRYRVSVEALQRSNRIRDADQLFVGQKLLIPY